MAATKSWSDKSVGEKILTVVVIIFVLFILITLKGLIFNSDDGAPSDTSQQATQQELSQEDQIKQLATTAATEGDGLAEDVREVRVIDELDGNYSVGVTLFDDTNKLNLIKQTMANVYLELYTSDLPVKNVTIANKAEYRNQFGDVKEIINYQTRLTKDVAEKINYDADKAVLQIEIIPGLWETQKLHPDLQEQN